MIVYPAIDIKDNQCVRLKQGNYSSVTVYSSNPVEVAKSWEKQGAKYLHLVDLDGAKDGELKNKSIITEIVNALNIPVQVGGGIRSRKQVEELLSLGVSRVIIGSLAIENQLLLRELSAEYKEKIAVGIDALNGYVMTNGWKVNSLVKVEELLRDIKQLGIRTIIYTDISKDGMLDGPNFEVYKKLKETTNLEVIASGGVSSLDDIKKLSSVGVEGVIVGKALYEGLFNFEEVLTCLQKG